MYCYEKTIKNLKLILSHIKTYKQKKMFHKNILIIFFILNLTLILSNNVCENTIPESSESCTSITASESKSYPDYCCYYESMSDSNKKMCRTVPYSAYFEDNSYETINDELYNVTCKGGIRGPATVLEQCGNVEEANEAKFDTCKKHSTLLNSCCFTKGKENIAKGCYWLGSKYEGDVNWAGVDLECGMNYLKFSFAVYLIFIFSILF